MDQCLDHFCLSVIVKPREEMDSKSRVEGSAGDEFELDEWYCKEDKKGKVICNQFDCSINFFPEL